MENNTTLNWGVVGAGGIAYRRTIPEGIVPSERCELVAIADTDPQILAKVAEEFSVSNSFEDYRGLLKLPDVDVVYIATPNCYHKKQAIAAAEAGKHVLVEKPIALTLEDAQAIIDACQKNGVKLMVGYMMRFHAHHQWLYQAIQRGDLGQPVFGKAQLTCWYPDIPRAWRQDPEMGGGGALVDMGSHCLDLLEMWLGPVKKLAAFTNTLTFDYPVDDSATLLLEFERGAQGVVEVNFNVPDDAAQNALEIRGTGGVVIADHTIGQAAGGNMTAFFQDQGDYDASQERNTFQGAQQIDLEPVNPYRTEVEHFCDCINNDKEPDLGGQIGLRNLQLVLSAYEASRTGKVVEI